MDDLLISDFLRSHSRQITQIVDTTHRKLLISTEPLTALYPAVDYASANIAMAQLSGSTPVLARIIAPESEVPVTKTKIQLSVESIGQLKVALAHVWAENDYRMLQDLKSANISPELKSALTAYFYQYPLNLTKSVRNRALRIAILCSLEANVDYVDPITNVRVNIDYRDKMESIARQFPAALTGLNAWSDPVNSTPLMNMATHLDDLYDLHGVRKPTALVLSYTTFMQIRNAVSTKEAWQMKTGGYVSDLPITDPNNPLSRLFLKDEEVKDLISAYTGVPVNAITVAEGEFEEEQLDGSLIRQPYFSDSNGNSNYYCFHYENGQVESAFVPTVEKNFSPGLFELNELISKLPKKEITAVCGNVVPIIRNAKYLAARKVS
jgi:hypothetical protein